VPVILLRALSKIGLDALNPYLCPGKTVSLIGSICVGKSTLINALFEQNIQKTADVRKDDERRRHKTTVRQRFLLSKGAILIDKPGTREIQLGDSPEGLKKAFSDIINVA